MRIRLGIRTPTLGQNIRFVATNKSDFYGWEIDLDIMLRYLV